ncbi:MAG: glycosyltransferase family 2 protein [Hyphomicrobium sp.]
MRSTRRCELAGTEAGSDSMISVIIPVYDRQARAERALKSVLDQAPCGEHAVEVILVDDGSTPPIEVRDESGRVKVVRLASNSGPAAARHAGILASSGELLAFLDSDDLWLPGKLAAQLRRFEVIDAATDGAGLLALVCSFYYPHRASGRLEARRPKASNSLSEFASGCWFAPGSTLLMRRSTYDAVGPFDPRLRRLEDLDWFIRFAQRGGELHVDPSPMVVIAPSHSASFAVVSGCSDLVAEKFAPSRESRLAPSELSRLLAYLSLELGAAAWTEQRYALAVLEVLRSFSRYPRLRLSLVDFWLRSRDIPPSVAAAFDDMTRGER